MGYKSVCEWKKSEQLWIFNMKELELKKEELDGTV